MLEIDKYSCGYCLHFKIPQLSCIVDHTIELDTNDTPSGVCMNPKFHLNPKRMFYIRSDITPRLALLQYGLKREVTRMVRAGTTCFEFGGSQRKLVAGSQDLAEKISDINNQIDLTSNIFN